MLSLWKEICAWTLLHASCACKNCRENTIIKFYSWPALLYLCHPILLPLFNPLPTPYSGKVTGSFLSGHILFPFTGFPPSRKTNKTKTATKAKQIRKQVTPSTLAPQAHPLSSCKCHPGCFTQSVWCQQSQKCQAGAEGGVAQLEDIWGQPGKPCFHSPHPPWDIKPLSCNFTALPHLNSLPLCILLKMHPQHRCHKCRKFLLCAQMKRFHRNGSDHQIKLRINVFYRSVLDPVPNKTHNNPNHQSVNNSKPIPETQTQAQALLSPSPQQLYSSDLMRQMQTAGTYSLINQFGCHFMIINPMLLGQDCTQSIPSFSPFHSSSVAGLEISLFSPFPNLSTNHLCSLTAAPCKMHSWDLKISLLDYLTVKN